MRAPQYFEETLVAMKSVNWIRDSRRALSAGGGVRIWGVPQWLLEFRLTSDA